MSGLRLAAAALLLWSSTAVQADPVTQWLLKSSEAARHATYSGVVLYHDKDMMETMRISHRHKNGREQERLTSLTGPPRDILREDDHVTCIASEDPASASALVGKSKGLFPEMSRATLAVVADHYELRSLGEVRVAGRSCRGMVLRPRDGLRYGYEVWADIETGVPLKVRLLDEKGQMIEEMMFTEVQFPQQLPDATFEVPAGKPGFSVARAVNSGGVVEAPKWLPTVLPAGYRLSVSDQRTLEDAQEAVDHVLLSDGLSSVSIFRGRAAPAGAEAGFEGYSNMGAMNAFGKRIGDFHYTVVGEVPQQTVQLIGEGLTAAND